MSFFTFPRATEWILLDTIAGLTNISYAILCWSYKPKRVILPVNYPLGVYIHEAVSHFL